MDVDPLDRAAPLSRVVKGPARDARRRSGHVSDVRPHVSGVDPAEFEHRSRVTPRRYGGHLGANHPGSRERHGSQALKSN